MIYVWAGIFRCCPVPVIVHPTCIIDCYTNLNSSPYHMHYWYAKLMLVCIRRPLPELERASLQLQSPMPSNPASPKPANPDTPRGIRASKHPSIPDCRNPLFDHLKGVTGGPSRTPQGISRRQTLSSPPSPWALNLMLPPAQERQIAHWNTLSNPVELTCHPKPSKQ